MALFLGKFLQESKTPLLVRRGVCPEGADGVVAHTKSWLVSDHPVRSNKGGFAAFFLMSRPPLLKEEGC
jgi:hypothetical protein